MKDVAARRTRFEHDELSIQIGGLASNLSRLAWCLKRVPDGDRLASLFRESKYFAEWAAARGSGDLQELLAEVQLALAVWERRLLRQESREMLAEESEHWAQRLLAVVGLA